MGERGGVGTDDDFEELVDAGLRVGVVEELEQVAAHLLLADVGGSVDELEPLEDGGVDPLLQAVDLRRGKVADAAVADARVDLRQQLRVHHAHRQFLQQAQIGQHPERTRAATSKIDAAGPMADAALH